MAHPLEERSPPRPRPIRIPGHTDGTLGRFTAVAIVETVSPTANARLCVEELFQVLGTSHKRHVLGPTDVREALEGASLNVQEIGSEDQRLDVDAWLESFPVRATTRASARQHVLSAPLPWLTQCR
jgi:hypothetical protein